MISVGVADFLLEYRVEEFCGDCLLFVVLFVILSHLQNSFSVFDIRILTVLASPVS